MPAAVSPAVATTAGAPQVVGTQVAQTMVLPSLFANLAPTSTAAAFGLVIPTPSAAASMQPASASGAMPVSSASQTVAAPFALPTLAFPSALPAISFPSISLPSGLPVLGAVQPASSATASPVAVTPATA
ncbi:uncharacterized protein L969DRAFT_86551 [Mixia osmundae IAM 14324]|nr:uncharacterized protein L969DRAFT_86551 [Mixia osmundae IAM 14324]KEI39945.1 hypothetical protein L969DRAFT_86551 [Mixia osmundae IAM 14324]